MQSQRDVSNINLMIKIGGSVLTDKMQSNVINYELIEKICYKLKVLYDRDMKFVIVTGVGSLGHQTVAKYSVHKGDDGSLTRRLGLLKAQIQVNKLRNVFLGGLLAAEIPAVQFYTSSIAESNQMKPIKLFLEPIKKFMDSGLIPVVSGDVVADQSMGFSVMSGDIAFLEIYKQWKPKLLVYGTDVDGIFTADPKNDETAQLIKHINSKMMQKSLKGITDGTNIDVSGAMLGKYRAIMTLLSIDQSIEVHLINLHDPENLHRLVDKIPFDHTIFGN